MTARKVWFSTVEYRPDPADAQKDILNLGFLLEFTSSKYWAIGVVIRAGLEESSLAGVDELTRKLLEHRADVISKEVARILPGAQQPGHALELLSAANPWSIHISAPKELDVSSSAVRATATIEKMLEEYVYRIYVTEWQQSIQAQEASHRELAHHMPRHPLMSFDVAPGATVGGVPAHMPPPWILSPTAIVRPLMHPA